MASLETASDGPAEMTTAQLTYRFGVDKHLVIDRNGYLFYNALLCPLQP